MVHGLSLEPKVLTCQGLTVTVVSGIISLMLDEKEAFARRLNEALNVSLPDIPEKGKGRQMFVASKFKVSQKGARKWLEGEGFPKLEQAIIIAKELKVSLEWLLTGRGERRMLDAARSAADRTERVIDVWMKMVSEAQTEWLDYGEYLLNKSQKKKPRKAVPQNTNKTT